MNKAEKKLLSILDINPDRLASDYGVQTISRGISYFYQGNVLEILNVIPPSPLDNSLEVVGRVEGRYAKPYITEVFIRPNENLGSEVSSECSCPVGNDCKHGIALLFAFLSEDLEVAAPETVDETDDVDEWLTFIQSKGSIQENPEELSHAPITNDFHLVYLLDYFQPKYLNEQEGFTARFVKARALKKGGYGQIYEVGSYQVLDEYYQPNLYYTGLDKEIIGILESFPSVQYGIDRRYYLNSDVAELTLKKMLKTGRCFWESQKSTALSEGEDRMFNLSWNESDNDYYPNFNIEPSADLLFELKHFYYLDKRQHIIGQAKHASLSFDDVTNFLMAPKIPKAKAEAASKRILQALPGVDFPLPVKMDLKEVLLTGIKPVFHLCLRAAKNPDSTRYGSSASLVHIASLSFQYGDVKFQPKQFYEFDKTTVIIIDKNTRYTLTRDLESEQSAIALIRAEGFGPLPSDLFSPLDMVLFSETIEGSVERWDHFKKSKVPELKSQGWEIEIDESFNLAVEYIDDWQAEIEESDNGDWFEMNLGFELNGEQINLLPLLVKLLSEHPDKESLHRLLESKEHQLFQLDSSQWVKIPTKRILQILDTIIELYDTEALNDEGALALSRFESLHLNELLNDPSLRWKGAEELQALTNKLHNFTGIESVELPKGLQAELRNYQKLGLDWLQFLRSFQFSGILADDMGLGKTIQTLANLLIEKESGRADIPSLVIAPTSLMSNWRNEAARFTPDLKVLILQGPKRKEYFSDVENYDLILTTYPLMVRDKDLYEKLEFHYIILDEAQAIKNAKAKTTQMIYGLNARHRICVTGTPMENHLGEVWSMYHFLMPGYLGTHARFNQLFKNPIEKNQDESAGRTLRKRVEPFLLRRTKDVVATELPEKTEIIRTVNLSGKQRDLYETVRIAMDKKVRDEVNKKGLARSHIIILEALLKLRQVCCDPQLVKLDKAKNVKESAKLEMLMSMLPDMVEEGRKILIFSQFTTMLGIIEKELKNLKITYSKLTGQTRKRAEAIEAFQEGDAKIFLISLKAGGVGLNLTAADTVIHYDPWWNPAAEKQATDRAYRIGQDKPVFVYKLLTENTIEEKILAMQEKKQALADSLYANKGTDELAFEQSDLMALISQTEDDI